MKIAFPRLYAIIDAGLINDSAPALAKILAQSGVELIQYRNKTASSRELFEISSQIAKELKGAPTRFIVNDRADVARLCGAGGVHVGQEDLPVEAARTVGGNLVGNGAAGSRPFWVGVSTHSLEQVRAAEATSADYIAVGPIYATATKAKPDAVVGVDSIRQARALTRKPLVAIGGISVERAADILRAGADSVAVARDLVCAPDPAARAREYLAVASEIFAQRLEEAHRT
jgi:thiamine-phosphate pyrophosphorylase